MLITNWKICLVIATFVASRKERRLGLASLSRSPNTTSVEDCQIKLA